MTPRREFIKSLGILTGAAVVGAWTTDALAQTRPADAFDLVVKGGEVLDPSQGLRALRDVGIRAGLVAAVEPDIPASRALRSIDAKGKLVTPGLVDLHAHVFPYGSAIGLPADELVPYAATTTFVSAGDAGANNLAAFRRHVVAQTRCRLFGFVHIANMGLAGYPVGELLNLDYADVDLAARAVAENRDFVLGVKVRESANIVGSNGHEPLRRAIAAVERAGGGRVMCHIGDAPGPLEALLNLLRPGDILTHAFSGAGNNVVREGRLVPAALAAKKRGVVIDVGHGGGSFDYTIAEPAIQQGLVPDVISSDIHAVSGNTPGMPYLPWVMSKFLNLGFELDQVIAMATINPAKVIDRIEKLGTLQIGAPGDIAILEVVQEPVRFLDSPQNVREGTRYLRPVQTIVAGRPFGRPYFTPFSVA
jgi:dihydroorotase